MWVRDPGILNQGIGAEFRQQVPSIKGLQASPVDRLLALAFY